MRICFLVYGGLDQVSGGFIYDRALVDALGSLGHVIDVIALPWVGYWRAVGASLVGNARATPAPTMAAAEVEAAEAMAAAAQIADVVIEDELAHPSLVRGVLRQPMRGSEPPRPPRIALVHNLRSWQPRERFRGVKARIERRYLRDIDAVVAVCQSTLDDVRALAPSPAAARALVAHPGRDHVAPGVDGSDVRARAVEPGPLRILHAASVVPAKGLDRLIDACALALALPPELPPAPARPGDPDRSLDLTIDVVGSHPRARWLAALERRIALLGLGARVRFHGQLGGAALHAIFRRSHVLAMPSDREAYSLACLEGLGFGLPVLATSAGGLGELLADGREGFLLDPRDLPGWARALRRLGADRSLLATLGEAAIARYRAHRTWREVALSLEGFLRSCLAARAPARVMAPVRSGPPVA